MKILICWYGSFEKTGTVGDLLALQSVIGFLEEKKYDFDYTSFKEYSELPKRRKPLSEIKPQDYDTLIYVCGPIIKTHPETSKLFEEFNNHKTIGVSVSILQKDSKDYIQPFSHIIAREGTKKSYEDLASLSISKYETSRIQHEGLIIGTCFRGFQVEYGIENCLNEKAEGLAYKVARKLIKNKGRLVSIENHLFVQEQEPQQIIDSYRQCDLILTTRLHGSLFALSLGIPFVAIDQIKGGAKVSRILSQKNWPHVHRIDRLNYFKLMSSAKRALKPKSEVLLDEIRSETLSSAKETLKELERVLELR